MKLKETLIGLAQGELVCFKDSKYILFGILVDRTWKGLDSTCWLIWPNFQTSWLCRQAIACPFQLHVWNLWRISNIRSSCRGHINVFWFIWFLVGLIWDDNSKWNKKQKCLSNMGRHLVSCHFSFLLNPTFA